MVAEHNMVYCATDWIGMAEPDVANAVTILQDLSTFGTLPDRSQQGILNTVFLGRLLVRRRRLRRPTRRSRTAVATR